VRIVRSGRVAAGVLDLLANDAERRALGQRAARNHEIADWGQRRARLARTAGTAGAAMNWNPLSRHLRGVVAVRNRYTTLPLVAGARLQGSVISWEIFRAGRFGKDSICNFAGRAAEGAGDSASMCFRAAMDAKTRGVLLVDPGGLRGI